MLTWTDFIGTSIKTCHYPQMGWNDFWSRTILWPELYENVKKNQVCYKVVLRYIEKEGANACFEII